jgi:hypothetical protein
MSQVSRPVQIALAATLLLALVWFVALRPKPAADGGDTAAAPAVQETPAAPGSAGLERAVDRAEGAVATADADAERASGSSADAAKPAQPAAAAAAPAKSAAPKRAARAAGAGAEAAREVAGPVASVRAALRQRKAIAIAFVDPATADARAVGEELRHVDHFGGRVFTLPVPLARLSDYGFITRNVEVTVAPTVVIVAPDHTATTIVGFTDRGEIEQRLAGALAHGRD